MTIASISQFAPFLVAVRAFRTFRKLPSLLRAACTHGSMSAASSPDSNKSWCLMFGRARRTPAAATRAALPAKKAPSSRPRNPLSMLWLKASRQSWMAATRPVGAQMARRPRPLLPARQRYRKRNGSSLPARRMSLRLVWLWRARSFAKPRKGPGGWSVPDRVGS